ncbi:MAG: hypothetical protein JOY92_00320 [Verrucomicrobia bacterium]|nr:hypothetical protein [Verrucomicrobiota bacterium]
MLIGLAALAAAGSLSLPSFADDFLSYDQVPDAAKRTIEENRGAGVVQQVEVFPFGKVMLYKVQVAINGVPEREIEVAETGKLIRVDDLNPSPAAGQENDDNDDEGSGD